MIVLTFLTRLIAALALTSALTSGACSVQAAGTQRWLRAGKPTHQAIDMLEVLSHAENYGLSPSDYSLGLSISQLRLVTEGQADSALAKQFDESLTRAASTFVNHLQRGRVRAATAGFHLPNTKPASQATDAASQIAAATDVKAVLEAFEPRPLPYRLLKQALGHYRQLTREVTVHPLPAMPRRSLEAGDEYAGAAQLRRLLVAVGDLPVDQASPPEGAGRLDPALMDAVRRFQERHGLTADGVIGKRTFATLDVPLQQRVRQIELSLERWRWLASPQRPDIIVNIPQFMLYALPRPQRPDEELLEIPVIVGRTHNRTPVFVAAIEQVIFQPYWDVPTSILRNELLPHIRKDASYLERHHFEIVRGGGDDAKVQPPTPATIDALAAGKLRLRQRPGPDNALGPIKFVLPNPFEVRMHGTAEPRLFNESVRAFSHGCIRVSDPAALAEYVLANAAGDWNADAVEAALCGTKTLRVSLKQPVQVVVFYATAAATRSRGVLFSNDIYGHDARLEKLLARSRRP